MKKKILVSGLLVAFSIGIYLLIRPERKEPEDLAAETKPILTTL